MIKDAEYYKPRIKDLPYTLVKTIEDLYKEASSHRFICMSLQELCKALELEYTSNSFESASQRNYIAINSYLEMLNLKLIPASVPVDLSFYDKIFITPKPDLNNDEDCAAVKNLVRLKKVPTQKDLIHISRMNEKLSNYNVMLRVFEGLFVVSSVKLDPHQRVALNNILSEMELPKEGLSYLRACYTYSSEYRNRHCDYSKKEYCFKPLNPEQQLQVSKFLAAIAFASNYKEPFNLEYPYIADLDLEYRRLSKNKKVVATTNAPSVQASLPSAMYEQPTNFSTERLFLDLKVGTYNYLHSLTPSKDDIDFCKMVDTNSPFYKNKLAMSMYSLLGKYVTPNVEKLIPSKDAISLETFDSIDHTRCANKLYVTDDKQLALIYPCMYYKHSAQDQYTNSSFFEYKAFLQNSTVIYDAQTNDTQTVTTSKTNLNILFFTFFMRLIVQNVFIKYDKEASIEALEEIATEYDELKRPELLFIRALYFVLFEISALKSNEALKLDKYTKLALFNYPELLNFALASLIGTKKDKTLQNIYESSHELFDLYIYQSALTDKKTTNKWLKDLKGSTSFYVDFIINCIHSKINEENIDKFITLSALESTDTQTQSDEKQFNNYVLFDEPLHRLANHNYKELQLLITHPVFSNLFAPLFGESNINTVCNMQLEVHEENSDLLLDTLNRYSNIIKYLASIETSTNQLLAKLVTGKLKKVEEQIIRRNLKDLTFTKYSQLCDIFKINYSYLANECIEYYLPQLGLMVVPIDLSLPKEARAKLNFHTIIATNVEQKRLDKQFINKLSAAQMAFIIFSYIVPINTAEIRLSRYMELSPELNVFAIKFFNTLKGLMRGSKPFDDSYYTKLYAEQKNNENFKLCIKYLKQLAIEEIASNPLKNYLEDKFNTVFRLLHIKSSVKKESDTTSTHSKAETTPAMKSSLQMSSEHSFFKANSFDTKSLDTKIIQSKLQESSQIQDVINKIRITEGTVEDTNDSTTTPLEDTVDTTTVTVKEVSAPEKESTSSNLPPSVNAQKLIEAIKSQTSDVIDLDEFSGICLSLKFMSKDAAIEEINDWAYDTFDDPIFDVAPEENCIYINTDILEKI